MKTVISSLYRRSYYVGMAALVWVAQAYAAATPEQVGNLLCPPPDSAVAPAAKGKKKNTAKSKAKDPGAALRNKLASIAKGKNINAADKNGMTALMRAAKANNRLACCWLVAKGANVALKNKEGKTAAELTGKIELKDMLRKCAAVGKKPLSARERRTAFWYHTPEEYALLVRRGFDVNTKNDNGKPALDNETNPDMAELMLALGMDIDPADEERSFWAALFAKDADSVKKMLAKNPNLINIQIPRSSSRKGIISYARTGELARVLLDAGVDVKQTWKSDKKTDSLLTEVVRWSGSLEAVRVLLERGATIPEGSGILYSLATCQGDNPDAVKIAELLIKAGADVNEGAPLCAAARSLSVPLMKLLLEHGAHADAEEASHALYRLVTDIPRMRFGSREEMEERVASFDEAMKELVAKGADPLMKPENDNCTLVSGVRKKLQYDSAPDIRFWDDDSEYTREGITKMVSIILKYQKTATVEDLLGIGQGSQVLSPKDWGDIMMALLDYIDPKEVEAHAQELLVRFGCYDARVAERLIKCGADVNGKINETVSVLSNAKTAEVVEWLLKHGARVEGTSLSLTYPDATRALIKAGVKVPEDMCDRLVCYPSGHYSGYLEMKIEDYIELGRLYKEAGADAESNFHWHGWGRIHIDALVDVVDPNKRREGGQTALMMLCTNKVCVQRLLKRGADINAQDDGGRTPLMHALRQDRGALESFIALLDAGAKTDIRNKEGKTVLQLAKEMKDEDFINELQERGVKK